MTKKVMLATSFLSATFLVQAAVLPDLPIPFKYGAGVTDNHVIYVGLGSAGKAWYKLDTRQQNQQWQPIAEFPGTAREQATAVLLDGNIYVFGGVGKNSKGKTTVLQDIYQYNLQQNRWQKLMTHSPRGMVGHVSFIMQDKAIVMGGVNQNIFNGYFADMNVAGENKALQETIISNYFNKPEKDYFYNRDVLAFDPSSLQWSNLGYFPWHGTAGSALALGDNHLMLISGEIKPGLRSPDVFSGAIGKDGITWQRIASIPDSEGVAGAFSGVSHGTVLLAGGTNFPGSAANYAKGKYYAHENLTKRYSDSVYAFTDHQWRKIGTLPEGLAYGVTLPWNDGVLLIGGEVAGGKALSSSLLLKMEQNKLKITE